MQLAADYDSGIISLSALSIATRALNTAVSGLVDPEALSEMSSFLKTQPEMADQRRRIFVSDKEPKVYVLSPNGFDLNLTVLSLDGGRVTPQVASVVSCASPDIIEQKMRSLSEKLGKICKEL